MSTLIPDFTGDSITPNDNAYAQAASTFITTGSPKFVLRPRTSQDVARAIAFAKEKNLVISVRSGGHSAAGLSTNDDGVVIDLTFLHKIEVLQAKKGLVRIGAGALWGDVADTLATHKLTISSGDTRSVGVGGLTLGGGMGWMVRKYGLTIDSLVGAEIVTADGAILRVDKDQNSDLFWAIRGGGGNFGIVTSFDFAAHPLLHNVHSGTLIFGTDTLKVLITGWRDYMRTATTDLTSTLMIMPPFGDNPPRAMVICCYAGDPAGAKKAIEPLMQLGELQHNTVAEKPYSHTLEEARHPAGMQLLFQNGFVPELTDALITRTVETSAKAGSPMIQIRSLTGAMSDIAADATAFAHRNNEAFIFGAMFLPPTASEDEIKKLRRGWDKIKVHTEGGYINFSSTYDTQDVASAYPPATYARLAGIKNKYDPSNLFTRNFNVVPTQ